MDSFGYVKLLGTGVSDGRIDVGEASRFLSGINDTLRYFVAKEDSEFLQVEYRLNVQIQPGSIIITLLGIVIVSSATAYLTATATQLAKNDIGDKNTGELLSGAVKKMKSTVKIAKHLGGMDKKEPEGVQFEDENAVLVIPNSKGEVLYVKREEFEAFFNAPEDLYEPLVGPIDAETEVSIASINKDGTISEEKITNDEKVFFTGENPSKHEEELTLPELVDGEYVELVGELTRVNGRTNTFGFAYRGHIITCTLEEGRVKEHKKAFLEKVRITGTVTRHYESTVSEEERKRPKLILRTIENLSEYDDEQTKLL